MSQIQLWKTHRIYLTPLLAIGVAIILSEILKYEVLRKIKLNNYISLSIVVVFATLITSEIFYPVVRYYYPWKHAPQNFSYRAPIRSMFINKYYSEKYFKSAAEFGYDLIKLPAKKKEYLS